MTAATFADIAPDADLLLWCRSYFCHVTILIADAVAAMGQAVFILIACVLLRGPMHPDGRPLGTFRWPSPGQTASLQNCVNRQQHEAAASSCALHLPTISI